MHEVFHVATALGVVSSPRRSGHRHRPIGIRGNLTWVDIHSDRRFEFDHDRATVWNALTHVERYPIWWPWLECDGVALAEGERWTCRVDPPLIYALDFELHVAEVVDERLVRAELTGDLVGVRTVDARRRRRRRCVVRLESTLAATAGPARLVARFAGPIARLGHDWVLDSGARRFRSALDDQRRECATLGRLVSGRCRPSAMPSPTVRSRSAGLMRRA